HVTPDGAPSAVRLWDVATGKLIRALEGHQRFITSLSFSPDGKTLATSSADQTTRLWDVSAGKELRQLKGPGTSTSLSFSAAGKVLAAGPSGPAVRYWDVATGKELHRPKEAHQEPVQSVSFAPDGRTLATATRGEGEDTVRLWDVSSSKSLRELNHPG